MGPKEGNEAGQRAGTLLLLGEVAEGICPGKKGTSGRSLVLSTTTQQEAAADRCQVSLLQQQVTG